MIISTSRRTGFILQPFSSQRRSTRTVAPSSMDFEKESTGTYFARLVYSCYFETIPVCYYFVLLHSSNQVVVSLELRVVNQEVLNDSLCAAPFVPRRLFNLASAVIDSV